jgi:glycosyltransferase involved in cell wall biosynthesis
MKILQVIGGGEKGGSRSHLMDLARGLEEAGHRVEIVCFLEDAVAASCRECRIPVTVFPMRNICDFSAVKKLSEYIARSSPDLVHTHGVRGNMIGRLSASRMGIPVVTTVHSSVYQDYSQPLKKLCYHRIEKMTRKYTYRFIAVAGSLKKELEEDGIPGDKIDVVYNGIKPEFAAGFAPGFDREGRQTCSGYSSEKHLDESDKAVEARDGSLRKELNIPLVTPVIMTIGRLEAVKNQEMFLNVCGELRDRGVNFHGVIVGDGPLRKQLEDQAQALNLHRQVSFLGFRKDIYRLLSQAELFLLTSRMEGMPVTLLEAMAAGTPVLVTAVGGMPEVIALAENGWTVEVDNVQECADKAAALLEDVSLREGMASRGKAALEKWFSYSTFVDNTLAVYKKVLQKG